MIWRESLLVLGRHGLNPCWFSLTFLQLTCLQTVVENKAILFKYIIYITFKSESENPNTPMHDLNINKLNYDMK